MGREAREEALLLSSTKVTVAEARAVHVQEVPCGVEERGYHELLDTVV